MTAITASATQTKAMPASPAMPPAIAISGIEIAIAPSVISFWCARRALDPPVVGALAFGEPPVEALEERIDRSFSCSGPSSRLAATVASGSRRVSSSTGPNGTGAELICYKRA